MYVVIYRYKVPSNMRKRYLELMKKTADLLLQVEMWSFVEMPELVGTFCPMVKF